MSDFDREMARELPGLMASFGGTLTHGGVAYDCMAQNEDGKPESASPFEYDMQRCVAVVLQADMPQPPADGALVQLNGASWAVKTAVRAPAAWRVYLERRDLKSVEGRGRR